MTWVYNAPTFVEVDNVFPEGPKRTDRNTASYTLDHRDFAARIDELSGEGDILEFGVCSGGTIAPIAKANPNRRVLDLITFKDWRKQHNQLQVILGGLKVLLELEILNTLGFQKRFRT